MRQAPRALALLAAAAAAAAAAVPRAEAHGFLSFPLSRNMWAAEEGRWWVPEGEDASRIPRKVRPPTHPPRPPLPRLAGPREGALTPIR